jgi:Icc-related predicted phosphoesterase
MNRRVKPSAACRSALFALQVIGYAVLAFAASGCAPYRAPAFELGPLETLSRRHFAVIGDTQSTLEAEVWRENNDPERRKLLPKLASAHPAFVVMVGDLVSWGSSTGRWREFDERSRDLHESRIPVLPVPGNHDYWGDDGLRLYFAHFPEIRGQRWYERRYGPLGMIFLDSNADPLGEKGWNEQQRWYEAALDRLEKDDDIRGILVFLHHAPFTNSSVVDDNASVRHAFVEPFWGRTKTLAMVTGHAHGYERFEKQGKAFIVTAGGGGPRGALRSGTQRCHADDLFRGPPIRNFNFVEFSIEPRGLHAYVLGLPKGERTFCRMEEFDLLWPGAANAPTLPPATAPKHDLPDCYCADGTPPTAAECAKPAH